jgi:hypothetical protein
MDWSKHLHGNQVQVERIQKVMDRMVSSLRTPLDWNEDERPLRTPFSDWLK